jgi:mannose-6-phosphate isomerase-like protein (cupin superfamily)
MAERRDRDSAVADYHFTLDGIVPRLPDDAPFRFHYALRHGSMKIGLYAPRGADTQTPHAQDELYIVVSGTGAFVKNGARTDFAPHDAIFVEAGAEHRFVDFTDDFSAWVIFWGPPGGEVAG